MRTRRDRQSWTVILGFLGLGIGLICAPDRVSDSVRSSIRDLTLPARWIRVAAENWQTNKDETDILASQQWQRQRQTLKAENERFRLRNRELQIQIALLHDQLRQTTSLGASPFAVEETKRLYGWTATTAEVLGKRQTETGEVTRMINRGRQDGLIESDLVIDDVAWVLDVGRKQQVEEGQPVSMGRVILGRIGQTGRWTSTVFAVSDVRYRGVAQIIRKSGDKFAFGARGILRGTGDGHCQLKFVRSTEAVNVGDEVYSARNGGESPVPLLYGKIVEVKLAPGAPHWDIKIEPAAKDIHPHRLQILKLRPDTNANHHESGGLMGN